MMLRFYLSVARAIEWAMNGFWGVFWWVAYLPHTLYAKVKLWSLNRRIDKLVREMARQGIHIDTEK